MHINIEDNQNDSDSTTYSAKRRSKYNYFIDREYAN